MDDVNYVNAHATSTPMGGVAEINAIWRALSCTTSGTEVDNDGKVLSTLLVRITKGATGDLLGAAGALEAALAVWAISKNTVLHTCNLDTILDNIAQYLDVTTVSSSSRRTIQLVQHVNISQTINIVMSNSFGFGGTNVSHYLGRLNRVPARLKYVC